MSDPDTFEFDETDEEDSSVFRQMEQLEQLETIIMLMEELGVETLAEARDRYAHLETQIEQSN